MDRTGRGNPMSSLQSALLASGVVVALALAFVSFRISAQAPTTTNKCWAAAGATVVAFAIDVASVMGTLGLPDETPGAVRIAWTVFGVLCAGAVAVFAYMVNAPIAAAGGGTGSTGGNAGRVFAAGGAFTGALTVMGVLAILLA
ncbi:hypothetical protein ACFW93_41400 [Streptomyces canus]|uniref:hypothetical protein n=1 Tax=Streptomyces canus TaxID=58343 RepID=UPI0036C54EA8